MQCLTKTLPPCQIHAVLNEAGHGRIANRATSVYHKNVDDFILDEDWASHIQTVISVKRSTEVFDTKNKRYVNRNETALYAANCILTAKQAHQIIINHWGVENKNHYVRDVSLCEDASRIRVKAYNLSVLRSLTLNILRKNGVSNIKGELYENSIHWTKVFNYPQVT